MRKLNKREEAVIAYLESNKNTLNAMYVDAQRRNDREVDWFLGHAAEAISIYIKVEELLSK